MVHVMTQNMESRKNMVQVLPVAGGGVGPQSPLPVTIQLECLPRLPLRIRKKMGF